MAAHKSKNQFIKTLPKFLLLVLFWGGLLTVILTGFFRLQVESHERGLVEKEQHVLNLQRKMTKNRFSMVVGDLVFLAEQEELRAFLEHPSDRLLHLINSEYRSFSAAKQKYEQIRYLDNDGMEVVRVNFQNGQAKSVSKAQLQSKQNRYYFKDAIVLDKGAVFVSPFDLNIEQGKVEKPHKPMIRFATPVFDQAGVKRGIVLINYLGQDFLDLIQEIGSGGKVQTMLANKNGYWLLHPDTEKEWGFMFAERKNFSFAKQNPELWEQILSGSTGQFHAPHGLYIYSTVTPLAADYISSTGSGDAFGSSDRGIAAGEYFWKIISYVPGNSFSPHGKDLKSNLLWLGMMLFLLGTVVLWFLTAAIARRQTYQAQLVGMAHYDDLTKLPNRTLFFDRLDQLLLLARRHERICAVLYIDLDGFKAINDTFGHAVGDQLLLAVGKRMVRCCRSSDTVARLGGDEFVVLLTEVARTEGVTVLAKQLLKAIDEPFSIQMQQVSIGASIGIAMFPVHGNTSDQLLKSADTAMYLSKKSDKSTYTFA